MNKTINVNIGGRIFNIEEAAYTQLESYLNAIRSYFQGHKSADEIISDIELRISELFEERINDKKQVVIVADVQEVISIMGRPEDYADLEDEQEEQTRYRIKEPNRRVFRDPDNKLLFGVCSGLSAYLGWDPIVLRALFVITTLFYGFGPVVYIILALIIPKAKTTAEKLQMRGEPVTVENISKKVRESFGDMKDDINEFGKSQKVNNAGKQLGDLLRDLIEGIGRVLKVALIILAKILGVVFMVMGIAGIVSLISFLLGWESILSSSHSDRVIEFLNATFSNPAQEKFFFSGIILVVGIPMVAFLLLGIRLLFERAKISGVAAIILIVGWFVGAGLLAASGIKAANDLAIKASFEEEVELNFAEIDSLVIDIQGADLPRYSFSGGVLDQVFFYDGAVTIEGVDSTNIVYIGETRLRIKQNMSSESFRLEVEKSARGASQKDAVENARSIKSSLDLQGDSLRILPYFVLTKGEKIRGQKLEYTLFVPEGKSIHFSSRSREIIYDIPNVTNTSDKKMINHTWYMTPQGLECTTCPPSPSDTKQDTLNNLNITTEVSGPGERSATS